LKAGTAGEVTYTVTTKNIKNGSYDAEVANRPNGVSVSGQVVIANNSGKLTLAGNTTTTAGTVNTLTLTIDGTTSGAFQLVITPAVEGDGVVSISGSAVVGQVLTAVTTGLGGSGTITYQ
jgi:hypothetical protein